MRCNHCEKEYGNLKLIRIGIKVYCPHCLIFFKKEIKILENLETIREIIKKEGV